MSFKPYLTVFAVLLILFTSLVGVASATKDNGITGIAPTQFFAMVFTYCVAIGIITQIAGTGGGVIFTTLTLGFTNIHPDIVRATGLLAAMAGTRMSARRFLRRGLANIRIILLVGVTYTLFAVIGALIGLKITRELGAFGVALIKFLLGVIILIVGFLYIVMKRVDYPEVKDVDKFTEKLGLEFPYYEESLLWYSKL